MYNAFITIAHFCEVANITNSVGQCNVCPLFDEIMIHIYMYIITAGKKFAENNFCENF